MDRVVAKGGRAGGLPAFYLSDCWGLFASSRGVRSIVGLCLRTMSRTGPFLPVEAFFVPQCSFLKAAICDILGKVSAVTGRTRR